VSTHAELAAFDDPYTGDSHDDVRRVVRQAGGLAVQARLEVARRTEPDPEAFCGETERLALLEGALVEGTCLPGNRAARGANRARARRSGRASQAALRAALVARLSPGPEARFPQGGPGDRPRLGRLAAGIESPGEHGDEGDREQSDDGPARGQPVRVDATTRGELGQGFLGRSEALVVLADEKLGVELEVVRVCAQKPRT